MAENNGSRWTPFLYGIAAGAIAGGVIGLLLAPKAGRETRHEIAEAAAKLRDKIRRRPMQVGAESMSED